MENMREISKLSSAELGEINVQIFPKTNISDLSIQDKHVVWLFAYTVHMQCLQFL